MNKRSAGPAQTPHVALRGASKSESSSDEILKHAKDERERRRLAKERPKAAAKIQCAWRRHQIKQQTRAALQLRWSQRYGSLFSNPAALVPPDEVVQELIPLLLAIHLPPQGTSEREDLIRQGRTLTLPPAGLNDTSCLRGCLYLLLKSLKTENSDDNLLGSSDPHSVSCTISGHLLFRVSVLCCSVIGAAGADALTQISAARVLALITSQESTENSVSAAQVRKRLSKLPIVAYAARRLLVSVASLDTRSSDDNNNARRLLISGVGNTIIAQINLTHEKDGKGDGMNNAAPEKGWKDGAALVHLVETILTASGWGPRGGEWLMGTAAKSSLQDMYVAVAECAARRASQTPTPITPDDALYLLHNLGEILNGRGGEGNWNSSVLTERDSRAKIVAYGHAAQALLSTVTQRRKTAPAKHVSDQGRISQRPTATAVETGVRMFTENNGFVGRLFDALPLEMFCDISFSVLDLLKATSTGGVGGAAQDILRVLSILAFSTPLLSKLWPWLAKRVGMPLEIPLQATQWMVASLPLGAYSVPKNSIVALTLFCRVHSHYLGVADDFEFHEEEGLFEGPFSLAQHRAIAAGLVALVFRTNIPEYHDVPTPPRKTCTSATRDWVSQHATAELTAAAPRLLRALYDRDVRKKFCPLELWLEPYRRLTAGSSFAVQASGAAVLSALLSRPRQGEDSEDSNASLSSHDRPLASSRPGMTPLSCQQQPKQGSVASGLAALLLQAPQCIPFEERVAVFRGIVELDKHSRGYHLAPIDGGPRPLRVTIRRTRLLEDALASLGPAGGAIRGPLSVTFINAQGREEAGVDMGGLTKELLDLVTMEVTRPDRGLFSETPEDHMLYPHPLALSQEGGADLLSLAGAVLGKSLYDGILLQAPLAPFFVSYLQGRLPTLDDLSTLDPEVYRNLTSLKKFRGDVLSLALDFTVESDVWGAKICEELVEGGAHIPVTAANSLQYIHLVADWHLRRRLGAAATAFGRGMERVLPVAWLRLFSAREVNQLLGGGEGGDVSVDDMRRHVQYNGYRPGSRTISLFWKVVEGMSQEERRALLRFATASSRPPLGGFAHLRPPLTIQKVDCGVSPLALLGGKDVDRLPSASTCANTLKLPNYQRAGTLREKLRYAIRSGSGFELS